MVLKVIDATELRNGTNIIIDGEVYQVKKVDISKTGKHGHSKVRFEANHIITDKKKVLVVPGHDKFEIPMIDKRKAQVLSTSGNFATLMDSETFDNFDVELLPEQKIESGNEVEYWDVEGKKFIKRVI